MRRWLPIGIALAAAALEAAGSPSLAFYLLLLAVPFTAVGALSALGELLDARVMPPVEPVTVLQPFLSGLALLLLVAGAAAGSTTFALAGCLAVFGLQSLLGLGGELRSPALER